jgi:hypothetical protein
MAIFGIAGDVSYHTFNSLLNRTIPIPRVSIHSNFSYLEESRVLVFNILYFLSQVKSALFRTFCVRPWQQEGELIREEDEVMEYVTVFILWLRFIVIEPARIELLSSWLNSRC